eukprot:TRINITY_DN2466_c0_g1_i1.p1 TRINITY_DN2466_c0_g1~~TRINITY_DN2466_c0_g1_i1.p1  ORF type:complete len:130 (+),score=24.59 TRINITY_DN2466_c0_g1_i1:85-474(+)
MLDPESLRKWWLSSHPVDLNTLRQVQENDFWLRYEKKRRIKTAIDMAYARERVSFFTPIFVLGSASYLFHSYKLKNLFHMGAYPMFIGSSLFLQQLNFAYGSSANRIEEHLKDILGNEKYWFVSAPRQK